YEEEHHTIADAAPLEVLRALMEANSLRQKDLATTFGTESIVSEVLRGKRELNKTHIEKLSKRFGVSPAGVFLMSHQTEVSKGNAVKSKVGSVRQLAGGVACAVVLLIVVCAGCKAGSGRAAAESGVAARPRIVFMTDFGTANDAVAICKAVMVRIAP